MVIMHSMMTLVRSNMWAADQGRDVWKQGQKQARGRCKVLTEGLAGSCCEALWFRG
jgi:hypothetical protein